MANLDDLQRQLAGEENLLAAANQHIELAQRKIESLRQQIEESQREIETTEELIKKLRSDGEAIQKRMALLRQYMELVQAQSLTVVAEQREEKVVQEANEAEVGRGGDDPAAVKSDEILGNVPYLEAADDQDPGELEFVELPQTELGPESEADTTSISFDHVDDVSLTHEILPHTSTFAEELLLVLAFHRKAAAPKNVIKIFRRLDYAPKQSATEKNVTAQVELNPHLFQYAAGGRIALTREGRSEALRLLEELY